MIWFLVILLPLLAAIITAFVPVGSRNSGPVFLLAALPAIWLGMDQSTGITVDWLVLGTHFSLDTTRRIILLLTAILWSTSGLFAETYLKYDVRRKAFSFYFGGAMAGNFGLLISADAASFLYLFCFNDFCLLRSGDP